MKRKVISLYKTALGMAFALVICLVAFIPLSASADTVNVTVGEMEYEGELIVIFTFDTEKPQIKLISPSDEEFGEKSSGVEFAEGEGWCSFKIAKAEAGRWKAEYEKGSNSEVDFSATMGTQSIAIQSFEVVGVTGSEADITFMSDLASLEGEYRYVVSVVVGEDEAVKELASGNANLGEKLTTAVDLSGISSYEEYRLKLEVFYGDDDKFFDSVYSDSFSYTNPDQSGALEDCLLTVDSAQGRITADWGNYSDYSADGYAVICYADDDREQPVFSSDLLDENSCVFSYPFDAAKLEIEIYKSVDGVLSLPLTKIVDLENGEYLKINSEEITGSAQAEISYRTTAERVLKVSLGNDEEAKEYTINGEGVSGITLQEGSNSLHCEFTGEDGVTYAVTKEIYFSSVTPQIVLYENLSGKSFAKGTVKVAGRVTNAAKLFVNGSEVALSENGEFSFDAEVKEDVNNYLVEAESPSGVKASQNVELKLLNAKTSLLSSQSYLPLIISLCSSAVIIVLGFVFIRKNNKKTAAKGSNPRTNRIILVICDVLAIVTEIIAVVKFIALYKLVNGSRFIEIAESSASEALKFLNAETRGGIIIIALGVLIIVLEIITIFAFRGKKTKSKKSE